MPKSNYGGKTTAKLLLEGLHNNVPLARVADVGPGMGTYTAFRQPGQHWTGIEAWAPYVGQFELEKKYDKVIVADMRYVDWRMVAPLDLVIFGDCLEHMSKADALTVLDKALSVSRFALISIPLIHAPQGATHGNPFEIHVEEDWTHDDAIAEFKDWCVAIRESYIGAYLLARHPMDRFMATKLASQIQGGLKTDKNAQIKIDVKAAA